MAGAVVPDALADAAIPGNGSLDGAASEDVAVDGAAAPDALGVLEPWLFLDRWIL